MKNKDVRKMGLLISNLLSCRLAMRKDEAERLASSGVCYTKDEDGWFSPRKSDGQINQVNHVTCREDGIAVIHVDGALSYRTDILSVWYGTDTYDSISAAFDECLSDESIKGIVFDINSPGGEVNGCTDLSDKIFNARGSKEFGIVARTGGLMCSAAYWIGSACEKVFTASNGTLGSIGVLCAYSKNEGDAVDVVVSDLSPNKAATPNTAAGLKLIKKELNSLASVFIETVARNRDVEKETVESDFGKGGVFVGKEAVDAGLADGVISLDDLCKKMSDGDFLQSKEAKMANEKKAAAENQSTAEEIGANAVAAYKQNIADVKAIFEGCGIAEDPIAFVDDGKTVADAKDFCFEAMKTKISGMEKSHAEALAANETAHAEAMAAKEQELEFVKAELKAVKEPNLQAIREGLEKQAAAQNSIEGGIQKNLTASEQRSAWAKDAAQKRYEKRRG